MIASLRRLLIDDSGATAIEYGLTAGLVALAIIAAPSQVGTRIAAKFGRVASSLS